MFSVFLAGVLVISLGFFLMLVCGLQIANKGFKFMFKSLAIFLLISFVLGPFFYQLAGKFW